VIGANNLIFYVILHLHLTAHTAWDNMRSIKRSHSTLLFGIWIHSRIDAAVAILTPHIFLGSLSRDNPQCIKFLVFSTVICNENAYALAL